MGAIQRSGQRGIYYTIAFANWLYSEAIVRYACISKIRQAYIKRAADSDNRLWSLVPETTTTWLRMMEELFFCPDAQKRISDALQRCTDNNEFFFVSVDATIKIAMSIRGQASYNKNKTIRNLAPIDDSKALRRVVTMRGRSGAVTMMHILRDESADEINNAALRIVPDHVRSQINHLGSDNPTQILWRTLRNGAMPNLQSLILDPQHLVFNYRAAHWRKSTDGCRVLRIMMRKFDMVDNTKDPDFWGPVYQGEELPSDSYHITTLRSYIVTGRMPKQLARRTIENIDQMAPWTSAREFIGSMAALASWYWHEIDRATNINNSRLYYVLWCATAPDKVQWYLNGLRMRHSLPTRYLPMLPSGTTSNEALHREVNQWFKGNGHEVYSTTIQLQLHVMWSGKIQAHNLASYQVQLKQYHQHDLVAAAAAHKLLTWESWTAWVSPVTSSSNRPHATGMPPLLIERTKIQKCIQEHARLPPVRIAKRPAKCKRHISKKPAAIYPKKPMGKKQQKRTVFTLKHY